MGTRTFLRAAGLVVWAFAGIPSALGIVRDPEAFAPGAMAVWFGAFVIFGVTFFRASRADAPEGRASTRLLLVQTACALTMNIVFCTGFEAALLIVVAVQLGLMVPLGLAVAWLVGQSVLLLGLAGYHMGWTRAGIWLIAVVGAEAFAFTVAAMAGREASARRALERTNAELQATRESLAIASRDAERVRIARELHDLLGHNLIVLHLELELLRHVATDDRAKERIESAQKVARGLLEDVRNAVSTLREDARPLLDITSGIRSVIEKVKEPRIHFEAPDGFDLPDPECATAVVRCVQEILTNTIKHAGAQNLWIAIAPKNGCVELTARDDGRGTNDVTPGNGLAGMRERLEKLGGELVIFAKEGSGFNLRATLPQKRAAEVAPPKEASS
jgi:signal transduction histidine kinase